MTTSRAGMSGFAPAVAVEPYEEKTAEQIKYEKMWAIDDYRVVAPGEQLAQLFLQTAKPLRDSSCIDFGCGTGRGSLMLALFGNLKMNMVDFAENALDEDVYNATITQPERIKFYQADLSKSCPVIASYGYCTDVMEHIPPEEVDDVLKNILGAASHVFFCISTVPDVMGARIGEPLHLTVESYDWWLKKLTRDHNCVVHWSQDMEGKACCFYVSSWPSDSATEDGAELDGKVNTAEEKVLDNIKSNLQRPHHLVHPYPPQDTEIMMLCGGPSLNDYEDEIKQLRANNMPLVTTNGTYNWCMDRGILPSMQLIIDARPFNKRFLDPVTPQCKYFIASQCDPSLFDDIPWDQTYIWHVTGFDSAHEVIDEVSDGIWFPVLGGSTVTLRGLCLLRMLGFNKIHMYGFDSCYRDNDHHAYRQDENTYKKDTSMAVNCHGKIFRCDPWMFSQAKEFLELTKVFGNELSLNVKGDGLIAHIIKTGAELSALEEEEGS